MAYDPNLWKNLKAGDRVVVVHLPDEFTQPSYQYNDTQFAYEWLIARRHVITVDYLETIDGNPYPWSDWFVIETYGVKAWHRIMLDHDGLERAN